MRECRIQLHEAQGTPTDALQKGHGEGFLPAGGQAPPQVQQQNKRWTIACGQNGWASPATASCHVGSCGSHQAGAESWRTAVPCCASAANKAESAKRPHGPIARSLAKAAGGRRRAQRNSVRSDCPGGVANQVRSTEAASCRGGCRAAWASPSKDGGIAMRQRCIQASRRAW